MADSETTSFGVYVAPPAIDSERIGGGRRRFSLSLKHINMKLPDGRLLFNDLNEIFRDQRVGLVGQNGSGKSMLAKLMAGLVVPTGGRVERCGTMAYVSQDIQAGTQTVAEVAGLAHRFDALIRIEDGSADVADFQQIEGWWDVRARFSGALAECGLGMLTAQSPARALSGGELTRVALLGAFLSGADALLLDEPTNHLDRPARDWLRKMVGQWSGGLIVASHDRELLEDMERIVEIDSSALRNFGGNYSFYRERREIEASAAKAALEHMRIERRTMLRALSRQHDAQQRRTARNKRSAKVANMPAIYLDRLAEGAEAFAGREQRRRQEVRMALDTSVAKAAEHIYADQSIVLMLPEAAVPAAKKVFQLTDALPPFPVNSTPLTLTMHGPIRVGVSGPNGCGKTTLLRMLAGSLAASSGLCETFVRSAWLDQYSTSLLPPHLSVLQRLSDLDTPLQEGVLRSHLALLGLGAQHVREKSANLSGGERLKAALACALWGRRPAQLLLLDEPTNHLDTDSVLALERALRDYTGALVVVSHDRALLNALALTHTLSFTENRWHLSEVG